MSGPWEDFQAAPEPGPWSDFQNGSDNSRGFVGNAWQDVKDLGTGISRIAKGVSDLPMDTVRTVQGMAQGNRFADTPLGQDYGHAVQAVPHLTWEPNSPTGGQQFPVRFSPGAIVQQYSDIATAPLKALPNQILPGMSPEQQKALPNPFYEHPVNTAMALLPLASPAMDAARAIPGVDEGLNAVGEGIRTNITAPLARRTLGKFPINSNADRIAQANQVGLNAVDTGVIRNPLTNPFSSGPKAMFERAQNLEEQAGQNIGSYLESQNIPMNVRASLDHLDSLKEQFFDDPEAVRKIEARKNLILKNSDLPGPQPALPSMSFEDANALKGYLQKKVNYKSDAASQEVGKAIAGSFRQSIDSQLNDISNRAGMGGDFQNFKTNKRLFQSADQMQDALGHQIGRESRNMPLSLPSIGAGLVEFLHGGGLKGIGAALGAEYLKRYGPAIGATMSNNIAKLFLSNPDKYSAILNSAVQSGTATLPAIEEALKQDPDFSQVIQNTSKQPAKKILGNKAAQAPKPLDEQTAMMYLKKANDDADKARQLAMADGFEITA